MDNHSSRDLKVSVLIPTYGGEKYLGETIQSVLRQNFSNFELIIVNDASPDNTHEIIKQFPDPRIKYIVHETNRGAGKARHTGLNASSGDIIAFLDQDDIFHPDKLQAHVVFYESHPDIGFTYNARFELNYSSNTIRDISRPPKNISLADLVLWFPLSPSDVVLRREWALRMDMLTSVRGAEIMHFGRLYMDGCKFGYVDRTLNYRRYHSRRNVNNVAGSCQAEISNQNIIFSDPRCPSDVLALREVAHANLYMYWAYIAFIQGETSVGQEFVREAIRHKPSILQGMPCELLTNLLINCIDDENQNHVTLLMKVFNQLPDDLGWLIDQYDWAVAQGYLLKAARAIIWGRSDDGHKYFDQAASLEAQISESFLMTVTSQLINYDIEYGSEAAKEILLALIPDIERIGGSASARSLISSYLVNSVFTRIRSGKSDNIRGDLFRAIVNDRKYLTNPGVLAVLGRSMLGID